MNAAHKNAITRYPVKPLGEVTVFLDHLRRPVKESERTAGPYPYFGANGQQGTIDGFIFDEPLVLLAEDGGHFDKPKRGIAYRIEGKSWVNNHAHVLRPKAAIDLAYLCRVLENRDVRSFVTGSTRAKLTKTGARQIPIPVPPYSEQRRIAEILDQADELRTKRRQAIALLDDLAQAVFFEMFGDPSVNFQNWPVEALRDQTSASSRNGLSPSKSGKVEAQLLTLSAVTGLIFDESATKVSTFAAEPPGSKAVDHRDFLVCRGNGNLRLVGQGFFPPRDMPHTIFPDTMIAVRIDPECLGREYLEWVWRSAHIRRQIESAARTTNGTYKINQKALESVRLPIPLRQLQEDFGRHIRKIQAVKRTQSNHLDRFDEMFASLQARAFRGEL